MNVIQSIVVEPEKWRLGQYTFSHVDGAQVWIAHGLSFYNLYPGGSWSLSQRWKFRKAFMWWQNNVPPDGVW